jgi:autotransporter-associated beta strand protein
MSVGVSLMAAAPVAAAERVWIGAAMSGEWSNPANWNGGVAPVDGDSLVFPAVGVAPVNDLAGLQVLSLAVQRAGTIGGAAITLGTEGLQLATGLTATVNLPITLGTNQSWTSAAGSTLSLGVVARGDKTLTVGGAGATVLLAAVSGSGSIVKSDSGQMELRVANNYTGTTTIDAGVLITSAELALGAGDGTPATGTVNNTGGTLIPRDDLLNEHLTVNGLGHDGGGAAQPDTGGPFIDAPVVLASNAGFGGAGITFNGPITGPGRLLLGDSVFIRLWNRTTRSQAESIYRDSARRHFQCGSPAATASLAARRCTCPPRPDSSPARP